MPSRNVHTVMRFRQPESDEVATLDYLLSQGGASFLDGGNPRRLPQMPQGLPLWKPPYSRMTAIDMNTGEHLWMTPLGNGDRIRNHPMLRHLDLPPLGGDSGRNGPVLTKTLLVYTLTAGGNRRRPPARRLRQGHRRTAGLGRLAWRCHRDPDDLHAGRPAIHRPHRGR